MSFLSFADKATKAFYFWAFGYPIREENASIAWGTVCSLEIMKSEITNG